MTLGNDEYSFVYDPTASIPAVVAEVGPYGTAEYYREPDGSLVARIMDAFGEDGVQLYHFDALGNTVLLTRPGNQGGTLVIYEYGAWGEAYEAIWAYNPYQYVGQLGYYTHYQDATLDMLQLGVRFYEPGTGRFGQRDSLPLHGRSDYVYVGNRPTLYTDPGGLETKEECHIRCDWEHGQCLRRVDSLEKLCIAIGTLDCSLFLRGIALAKCIAAVSAMCVAASHMDRKMCDDECLGCHDMCDGPTWRCPRPRR